MAKRNQSTHASAGRLSVMRLSLIAAMAMMASAEVHACSPSVSTDTVVGSGNSLNCVAWTGGNLTIANGGGISGTSASVAVSANMVGGGTLTNQGTIQGIKNIGAIGALNNDTGGAIGNLIIFGVPTILNGILNTGSIGTLNNNAGGTIGGSSNGIANTGTIQLLNNNTGGTINSNAVGILSTGFIGTLTNTSTINGSSLGINNSGTVQSLSNNTGGTINGSGQSGIRNSVFIGTLANTGTIGGLSAGIFNSGTIQSLSNNAGGTINGLLHSTSQIGIGNSAFIDTLINAGLISGSGNGISNTGTIRSLNNNTGGVIGGGSSIGVLNGGTIALLNNAGGTISGVADGLKNTAVIAALNNTGKISGPVGVYNDTSATLTALNNNTGGTISGPVGIQNNGHIGTLTNTGLIQGSTAAINNNLAIGAIANNGGTIAGTINNLGSSDWTITGGAGSIFGILTGSSGGIGSADVGRLNNTLSNLVFSSGNQLLNDNINVTGHAVINSGSALQINNKIAITGDYTQNAGGTLSVGVADGAVTTGVVSADSGYGRMLVSGVATFDAGSHVTLKKLDTFAFAQGQRFVVVQAANASAHYNDASLNYSAIGYNGSVTGASVIDTGDATKTDLVLTVGALGANVPVNVGAPGENAPVNTATTSDAKAALSGLFNYTGTDVGLLAVFNPAAALGSSPAANKAGAQLSPAATGSASVQAAQSATQGVTDVANAHIDTLRVAQGSGSGGSGIATGERPTDVAVWGQAFGGQSTQNDRAGAAGYKAGVNGMLVGVDTAVNDQWRVGGLIDYANISIANTGDNTGSSGHVTSYGVLGYAGYAAETWYLNLSAGVAAQKYNTLRAVNFTGFAGGASGSFDGTNYSAAAQAGYPIKLDAATTLTPIGSLMYQRLHQDGYTETGSAAALQIGSAGTTSIKSDLGAKLERMFKTSYGEMTPSAQLSWRHEYRDTVLRSAVSFAADTTGSTGFVSQGAAPEKDAGVLVLGVTLVRSQNLTLAAHYTLEAASGYASQIADVKLRYQF